jgi:isopropylmalate/homocitrate/citramalate synthase
MSSSDHLSAESIQAGELLAELDDQIRHPVQLYDETLRDGEQSVGVAFDTAQKIEIADLLVDAGIRWMTIGFPAVSDQEREAVRAVATQVAGRANCFGLARLVPADMEAVAGCGLNNVALWCPISDLHLSHKLRIDPDTAYTRMKEGIRHARQMGLNVRFGFEDATRSPLDRILRFVTGALEEGISAVNIADTCGVLTPIRTHRLVRRIIEQIGTEANLFIHFHNDLGMATANSLMAVAAGARFVQGSFAGLGERAGNTCLEELAVALRLKYGVDTGVDLARLSAAARRIAEIARLPVAPCKPIIGDKVYAHESGIHVAGVMSNSATYECYPPPLVGRSHEIHFGKHAGMSNMRYLAKKASIDASDEVLESVLGLIKRQATEGRSLTPGEAEAMLRRAASAGTD